MESLLAFTVTAFVLTGSPGPANLALAATGAAFGMRRGLRLMEGVIVGVLTIFVATAAGLSGLLLAVPGVAGVVTAIASVYILYLAWRIASAPPLGEATTDRTPPSIGGGLVISLLNPKPYAVMTALNSGYVVIEGDPVFDAVVKGLTLLVLLHVHLPLWLLLGAALTRLFRDPTVNRAINISFALLLIASMAVPLLL